MIYYLFSVYSFDDEALNRGAVCNWTQLPLTVDRCILGSCLDLGFPPPAPFLGWQRSGWRVMSNFIPGSAGLDLPLYK